MNASTLALNAARTIQAQVGIPGITEAMAAIIEREAIAPLFNQMPEPPDDMGSQDGLEAYAEAIALWREQAGFPLAYDGPTGEPIKA